MCEDSLYETSIKILASLKKVLIFIVIKMSLFVDYEFIRLDEISIFLIKKCNINFL